MAAGVDVIASVIAVAGLGIKLSKTLYQVGHKTANAGHNINRIATNVSLFASMLKHVGSVLDDAHSLHSPEAVETVKQILNECEAVFQEITNIIVLAKDKSEGAKEPPLANGSKRRISMIARAKWYFEGPKAERLLAQLEYLKTTLSVLLQTLSLAALNAKIKATLGESTQPSEIVQQEKLHLETLVVAQQLSVHVMQETEEKMEAERIRPSSPTEEGVENRYPKLLTHGSSSSLQLVRFNSNDLNFLERRPSVLGEEGTPLDTMNSRSEACIQELLAKWTVSPEEKYNGTTNPAVTAEEPEVDREATPVPHRTHFQQVTEPRSDAHEASTRAPYANITSQLPEPVGIRGPPQHLMTSQSDAAALPYTDSVSVRSGSSLGYPSSEIESTSNRIISPRTALERSITNPEADGMPVLNMFHDHHGLIPQPQGNHSSYVGPLRLLQAPIPTGPRQPAALAPYMAGAAAASGNAHLDPGWSNYRQPYVSDEDSTWSPSDSDDSRPASRAGKTLTRMRRGSNLSHALQSSKQGHHRPHDSGHWGDIGDGLDIPWRIRVSSTKYFDFRDDKLVGPRTPYLPQESKAWIYGHEAARTEISTKWVCKEALNEMRYPHTELRGSQEINEIIGEEGGWRILQPLKFHEIDSLVDRTIRHVEMAKHRHPNSGATLPVRQIQPPLQPLQNPTSMPRHPPFERRHMSYSDTIPPLHPPAGLPSRGVTGQQTMSPRDLGDIPHSPRDRHTRGEKRDLDPDRESNRDRNRERRRSRSRHRHREREREKQPVDKKREKHKSNMGTTLAKVGTLAVLLEGLDGAFL